MNKIDALLLLADRFEKKAQQTSAEPGDIRALLQRAKLWNISSIVAPLLERTSVPGHTTADISIVVNPGPTPTTSFVSNLTPNHPEASQQLNNILKQKFGRLMDQALQSITVTDPVTVNWLRVTKLPQSQY